MRFTTSTHKFASALAEVRRAVPTKPTLAAYAGVLVKVTSGELQLTGSDGDTTVTVVVDDISRAKPGDVLIQPQPIAEYLATVGRNVELTAELDDVGDLVINAVGTPSYTFRARPETFPSPSTPRREHVDVDWSDLSVALEAILPSVDPNHGGVQMRSTTDGKLLLMATDGKRAVLSVLPNGGFGDFSGILPAETLKLMARHDITSVLTDPAGRWLRAASSSAVVTSTLLDVPVPDVSALAQNIPPHRVVVQRHELATALRRLCSVAASDRTPLRGSITSAILTLHADSGNVGTGKEQVKFEQPADIEMEFAISGQYLADAVDSLTSPRVQIAYGAALQPIFLRSSEPVPTTIIVSPMRVS